MAAHFCPYFHDLLDLRLLCRPARGHSQVYALNLREGLTAEPRLHADYTLDHAVAEHQLSDSTSLPVHVGNRSPLQGYLANEGDDPWSQQFPLYAKRRPLPGVSCFSVLTGEPTRTPQRRRYTAKRRAEVAYTRNHGGACKPCRKAHQAASTLLVENGNSLTQLL